MKQTIRNLTLASASLALLAGLSACVNAPPRPQPADALKLAYTAMTDAMAADADDYAHEDLETARARYALGLAQYTHSVVRTQQLAEESLVLAQLALAKTEAAKAAALRMTAQAEVDELEALAKPPTPTAPPPIHRRSRSHK